MTKFKETFLVDYSSKPNKLITCEFTTLESAEFVAHYVCKLVPAEVIQLLQIRIRYDKYEEEDE